MSVTRPVSGRSSVVQHLFADGSIACPPPQRVGVVAPHPDDETLAAGGLISDLVRAGCHVSIVVVTDGAASHSDVEDLRAIREAECRRAATLLGIAEPPIFLGFPDGRAEAHIEAITSVLRQVLRSVDVIISPRLDDGHDDHHAVARALEVAFDVSGPLQMRYAIWGWEQLNEDQLNVDAGVIYRPSAAALDAKKAALAQYVSQTTDAYGHVIVDEAMLHRHTSATEVFWP